MRTKIQVQLKVFNKCHFFLNMFADSELRSVRLFKSPRTMLITRKSLVVHEFRARMYFSGVFCVRLASGVVVCGSV